MTNTPNEWHRHDADQYQLEQAADREEHDRDRSELHGDYVTDRAELAQWMTERFAEKAFVEQAAAEWIDGGWRS